MTLNLNRPVGVVVVIRPTGSNVATVLKVTSVSSANLALQDSGTNLLMVVLLLVVFLAIVMDMLISVTPRVVVVSVSIILPERIANVVAAVTTEILSEVTFNFDY